MRNPQRKRRKKILVKGALSLNFPTPCDGRRYPPVEKILLKGGKRMMKSMSELMVGHF